MLASADASPLFSRLHEMHPVLVHSDYNVLIVLDTRPEAADSCRPSWIGNSGLLAALWRTSATGSATNRAVLRRRKPSPYDTVQAEATCRSFGKSCCCWRIWWRCATCRAAPECIFRSVRRIFGGLSGSRTGPRSRTGGPVLRACGLSCLSTLLAFLAWLIYRPCSFSPPLPCKR